ncbi:MAG: TonB-dependent receptor [bacterium]|nr:TonB-dependent receptor [bacterium]
MFAFVFTLYLAAVVALAPLPAAAQSTAGPPQGGSETVESQVGAKESSEAPESSGPTGEEAEELGPVVVTATKTAVPVSLSPFSTEVITGQDIEEKQVTSVKEALRTARGLHVVSTGREGAQTSIFVRGGESDHNLVLLDGIPYNDAGGLVNFADLTADNIERIEIVRGAGSALYGSDAMTSVIQIITKEGDGPPTLTLSSAFGDQGTTREVATLQGSRPGVRYSFTLSRYDTDGFFEPNDFYGNTTARGKVSIALTDYTKATFTVHYVDQRKGLPGQTGFFVFDRDEFSESNELALGLKLAQEVFPWFDHAVFLAVMDRRRFTEDLITDSATVRRLEQSVIQNPAFDFINERSDEIQRRLADYHFNVTPVPNNVITGGVEWELEEGEIIFATPVAFGGSTETFPFVDFNDERRNMGYYLQGQFNWRDRVIVVPGVRLEDNEAFGGETLPRVAAALILGDPPEETWVGPLKLRASWGEGIKEPQFGENFSPPPFRGDPGLAPEETEHWDAGAELTLCKGRCFIEAVYFHVRQKNLISFITDSIFPFTGHFENLGKARSEGLEVFGAVEPWDWLRIEGQYTGLETVIKESASPNSSTAGVGKELLRRPKHSGSTSVVGTFGPITVRGDLVAVGRRPDTDGQGLSIFTNPGYTRVDLAARFRLENHLVKLWDSPFPHSVEAFARVENLFDEDYEEALGFPAPGINILAGVQITLQGASQELSQARPRKPTFARR